MQLLAERPRATAAIFAGAAVLAAAALAALPHRHHHHRWYHHEASFDPPYGTAPCHHHHHHDVPPPAPPAPLTYDAALDAARARFAACGGSANLLLEISPDGHVRAATTHPDPETPAARCLANVAAQLAFPAAETTVVMRVQLPR